MKGKMILEIIGRLLIVILLITLIGFNFGNVEGILVIFLTIPLFYLAVVWMLLPLLNIGEKRKNEK